LFSVASRAPASQAVRHAESPPATQCACIACCGIGAISSRAAVLRRDFGEARLVATTIEAGLIDGRANIKIEVSAKCRR